MRRLLLVLAGLAVVAGACGDDDSVEPDLDATSTTVAVETTIAAAAPTTTTTAAVARTQRCETVAFTPQSEDAASDITATGLDCDEAEAFVRVAGRRTSSGGPEQVDVDGYRCVRTRYEEEPLPRSYYECTSGSKKVTFVRS